MAKSQKDELSERIEQINKLFADRARIDEELRVLTGLKEKAPTPPPDGFEYKAAVLAVFKENPNKEFTAESIAQLIAKEYDFEPDRKDVANRINYLRTRTSEVVAVEGKRGVYRLGGVAEQEPIETDTE